MKASEPSVHSPVGAVMPNCAEKQVFIASLCQPNSSGTIVMSPSPVTSSVVSIAAPTVARARVQPTGTAACTA